MLLQRQQGEFLQADFFDNSGGLNITDAPFRVAENQAIAGHDYDYYTVGGIRKRYGHTVIASSTDTYKRSLGFGLNVTSANAKTLIRAADSVFQSVNTTTGACTVLTDDTSGAVSSFLTSTQPVVMSQFNTTTVNALWATGGGLASGVVLGYTGSGLTQNGSYSSAATSSGLTFTGASTTGGTLPGGTSYYYALAFQKASTSAISNCTFDASYSVPSGTNTNKITVNFNLTGLDTTKYSNILVYRSNAAGSTGFTTGDLAGTVSSTATSFIDTGAVQLTANTVPRSGSLSLDNSTLPAGTYNTVTTWKRRLVTAQGSTLYLSDLNKPESWPAANSITIPSGGNITALGIISFSTPTTVDNDEFLVVFKERELWVVTGNNTSDWSLKFIDYVGCVSQSLLVWANGFIAWIDYRGVYLWDGSYKPIYCSRPIEFDFGPSGDINLSKLSIGWGSFYRKQNQIVWVISSNTMGENALTLKLDVRLTYPNIGDALAGRILDSVFIKDTLSYPLYAGLAALPNSLGEVFYGGDKNGNIYTLFQNANYDQTNSVSNSQWDVSSWDQGFWDYTSGVTAPIGFKYRTKILDLGKISTTKRIHKIIAWCKDDTTANLTLNYWLGYKLDSAHMADQRQPIALFTTNAYWDQGYWDQAQWDLALPTYNPVVFNLENASVGIEGDAITLEFLQSDLSAPVTIAGFSVIYSETGLRK